MFLFVVLSDEIMDIEYIAFDSLGVQSSCFQVSAGNETAIIDPGLSIQADSFPLSESKRLYLRSTYKHKIKKKAKQADVGVISHYHYDHFTQEPDRKIYGRKRMLVKDPDTAINEEQQDRAHELLDAIDTMANRIDVADGQTFYLDQLKLKFGKPQWHGPQDTEMGQVLPLVIEDTSTDRRVLYTSDLDGPVETDARDWIVRQDPDVMIYNGPPTYLLDFVLDYQDFAKGMQNMITIIEDVSPSTIILDHHLLRDYRYKDLFRPVFTAAEQYNTAIHTAAEEQGETPVVAEAYQDNGPTKWTDWPTPTRDDIDQLAQGIPPAKVFD